MTKSLPRTRKVGAPQAIFSLDCGSARQILRIRVSGAVVRDLRCALGLDFMATAHFTRVSPRIAAPLLAECHEEGREALPWPRAMRHEFLSTLLTAADCGALSPHGSWRGDVLRSPWGSSELGVVQLDGCRRRSRGL